MKDNFKAVLFLILVLLITTAVTYLLVGMIVFEKGNLLFPVLWLAGFSVLFFNISLTLMQAAFYLFLKEKLLPEIELRKNPPAACLYPVKDENFGLYERIRYTIRNNRCPNVDFWVLSDSSYHNLNYENEVILKLRKEFGDSLIKYRRRDKPTERKQGNIKDWIGSHGGRYKYMLICDADSIMPKDTIAKFLRKAEHPVNRDIAIFQGGIRVVHAKTYFSKFIALATESSQRFNVAINWRIFKRAISIGHGNLIRIEPFSKLNLKDGIICHDIWETTYLDRMGYKTVFCEDIVTFEEVPTNYLECKQRESRWAKGTLQAISLPFLPNISFASRYYVGYSIYSYISHVLLLLWLISGFFCSSEVGGQMLTFQRYSFIGYSMVDLELSTMLIGSLFIIAFNKLVACRNLKDVKNLVLEVFFSTLIALNNIFYTSLNVLLAPFKKFKWQPMSKDPLEELSFIQVAKVLSSGTLFGLLCLFLGWKYSPHWALISSPFIISFIFSIPLVYITSFRTE